MSDDGGDRHNVYLPAELEQYYQEHENEMSLSKLLQGAVEDHQLRHTGNKERLQRQIRANEAAIAEKEGEIDELHSENEVLRERLERIDEVAENQYESVRSLLNDLVEVAPDDREAAVKRSDVQIPTVKVMKLVDAVNLHYFNGVKREWEDGEEGMRMTRAVDDAGLDYGISPLNDESCHDWLSQMLPEEEEAFEEEWEAQFASQDDEE